MQKLAFPAPFIFRPELEGAGRHFRIRLIGPVGATHDPRLAAGRCARIARAPGVDEGNFRAALEEMQGGPSAEGSGAYDRNVRFGFHHFLKHDTCIDRAKSL